MATKAGCIASSGAAACPHHRQFSASRQGFFALLHDGLPNPLAIPALYVIESFALHAPYNAMLVIKEHPLDCEFRSWNNYVRKHAKRLRIEDRVVLVAGGDLNQMAQDSLGIVTVNSTSGTLGLAVGTPVFVLGSAIYDIPGITHQGRLDDFWKAPEPPNMGLYNAFRKVLHAQCLIPGGLASQSAIATLIESTLDRLFADPAHIRAQSDMDRILRNQATTTASSAGTLPARSSAGASRMR